MGNADDASERGATSVEKFEVLHVLPDLAMGGGQQVVLRTIQHMDATRFRNHVCYFLPPHDWAPRFREIGIEPRYLEHGGVHTRLNTLCGVMRLIRERGIDLVHVQGTAVDKLYGQLAALFCGVPVIRTLHGPRFRPGALRAIVRNGAVELLDYALEPLTARHYIAVSDAVRASWREYLMRRGIDEQRVTVVPNGVAMSNGGARAAGLSSVALREELKIGRVFPVLINVGRWDRRKGQMTLIPVMGEILRHYPEAVLLLIGDGPMRAELEQAAAGAGIRDHVRLTGQRNDVPDLLSVSDVLVFPSFGEGMPLVVLEAMAAGLPVVAYDLPGLPVLVRENVTGRLARTKSPGCFAQALLELLADREALQQMGRNAKAIVAEQFDIEKTVDGVERIYLSVLKRYGRGSVVRRQACTAS